MSSLIIVFVILRAIVVIILVVLIFKALIKYLRSNDQREEEEYKQIRKSLGETLKEYRVQSKMTQEFVAEHLEVSRQAVSKWERGVSDPSTSNLIAIARLYGISAEELLREVET